jgi:hypothetical protein
VEELEGFPNLKNYFLFWKITYRSKLFLHLFKKQHAGDVSLLESDLEIGERKFSFDKVDSNFSEFTDVEFNKFEESLKVVNEKFDTKYSELKTVDEFFKELDVEEPEFNIELFQ